MARFAMNAELRVKAGLSAFCLTSFISGLAIAFFQPVTSLFLATEVGVAPFKIGLFFAVEGLFAAFFSQLLARWSDFSGRRNAAILLGAFGGALTCVYFSCVRNYWWLFAICAPLYATSKVGALVFASAREYCQKLGRDPVRFSGIVRACFALAWVFGPPAALIVAESAGFSAMYLCSCTGFMLMAAVVYFLLPEVSKRRSSAIAEKSENDAAMNAACSDGGCVVNKTLSEELADISDVSVKSRSPFSDKSAVALLAVCTLCLMSNQMYLMIMPQYVTLDLGFEPRYAGFFMGTAAFVEIPFMIFSGNLAGRFHMKYILASAVASGCLFYLCLPFLREPLLFGLMQVCNAYFIAMVCTLSIVYFQELLPHIVGQASNMFVVAASIGTVSSGFIGGFVAETFGFVWVFRLAFMLLALACCILFFVRKVRK